MGATDSNQVRIVKSIEPSDSPKWQRKRIITLMVGVLKMAEMRVGGELRDCLVDPLKPAEHQRPEALADYAPEAVKNPGATGFRGHSANARGAESKARAQEIARKCVEAGLAAEEIDTMWAEAKRTFAKDIVNEASKSPELKK